MGLEFKLLFCSLTPGRELERSVVTRAEVILGKQASLLNILCVNNGC